MHSKSSTAAALLAFSTLFQSGVSFQPQSRATFLVSKAAPSNNEFISPTALQAENPPDVAEAAEQYEEPKLTDKGLPELKGDFDWDEKFSGDDDWITEDVPGKIVLDEVTLAKQVTALDQLETAWRKDRLRAEYDDSQKIGFVAGAEKLNGRFAMFFLVTGLLTEFWTGISIPGQVEEMLRVGGVIGFDG